MLEALRLGDSWRPRGHMSDGEILGVQQNLHHEKPVKEHLPFCSTSEERQEGREWDAVTKFVRGKRTKSGGLTRAWIAIADMEVCVH